MVKWDEYRVRRDAIVAMYIEARQKLALKKVWTLLSTFYEIITDIWRRYRVKYNIEQIKACKDLAVTRIKGVYKLNMVRKFAQHRIRR